MLPRKSDVSFQDLLPTSNQDSQSSGRQSQSSNPTNKSNAKLSILKSYEVNGFKNVNGQYELQGRLGVAIISNSEKTEFKILIFGKGGKAVTQALLLASKSCITTTQQPLYVTLLDGYNCYWSLLFDNDERMKDFLHHATISRLYSTNNNEIIEQTLSEGDGDLLQNGDTAEIQYTGWIIESDCSKGNQFDSNFSSGKTLKVKLGQTNVIKGLTSALLQCKKGSEKIFAIPPILGYGRAGLPPKIPANHALLYLITVLRVKVGSNKNRGGDTESTDGMFDDLHATASLRQQQNDEMPLPFLPPDDPEPPEISPQVSVKDRTRSISEKLEHPIPSVATTTSTSQSTNEKSSKSELINRMAKMGQSVLRNNAIEEEVKQKTKKPKKSSTKKSKKKVSESSEEEEKSESKTEESSEEEKKPKPKKRQQQQRKQQKLQEIPIQEAPPIALAPHLMNPSYSMQQQQAAQSLVPFNSYPQNMLVSPANAAAMQNFISAQQAAAAQILTQPAPPAPAPPAAAATTSSSGDQMHLSMLVNETRQQNVEMRMAVAKLEDKIEKLRDQLDVSVKSGGSASAATTPAYPSLESGMLLQNLTRIIRENESLKEEIYSKNMKLEELNKRITNLLIEKETHFDEANTTIEKRSTAFKTSAIESQNRVLQLEEEKLRLARDLSSRNEELYNLQKEYDELRVNQRNLQIRFDPLKKEVEDLTKQVEELTETKNQWESSCQSLQKLLKTKESDIQRLTERCSLLEGQFQQQDSATIQRLYRLEEEKQNLQTEMENQKLDGMQKMDELQKQLRDFKAKSYQSEDLVRTQLEETISEQWKKKCDEIIRAEKLRSKREMKDLDEEKEHLTRELNSLQEKFDELKKASRETKSTMSAELTRLNDEVERLHVELEDAKHSEGLLDPSVVIVKVKGIMNTVFQEFKKDFITTKSYSGDKIVQSALAIIRKTTLKLAAHDQEEEEEEEGEKEEENSSASETEEEEEEEEESSEEEVENSVSVVVQQQQQQPVVVSSAPLQQSVASPEVTSVPTNTTTAPLRPGTPPPPPNLDQETSDEEESEEEEEEKDKSEDEVENEIFEEEVLPQEADESKTVSEKDDEKKKEVVVEKPPETTTTVEDDEESDSSEEEESAAEEVSDEEENNVEVKEEVTHEQQQPVEEVAAVVVPDPLNNSPPADVVDSDKEEENSLDEPLKKSIKSEEPTTIKPEISKTSKENDSFNFTSGPPPLEDFDFNFTSSKTTTETTSVNDKHKIAAKPIANDDAPLFSDEDDDETSRSLLNIIKRDSSMNQKKKDDSAQDKVPPPLFGSDDDDDDMSWLNSTKK